MNPQPYGEAIDAAKADSVCNEFEAFYLTRVSGEEGSALFTYTPVKKSDLGKIPADASAVYETFRCNDWRQVR